MATKRIKVTLVMVMSLDGKTTQPNASLHSWTSPEDQKYFAKQIEQAACILMGRKTYDTAKTMMKHTADTLRVVFTNDPKHHAKETIPNQLEFTSDNPQTVLNLLAQRGVTNALLVGGASLNSAFLEENLIDELWLTVEPLILGQGNPLFAESAFEKNLKLISLEKLNAKGTLLLKYRILNT